LTKPIKPDFPIKKFNIVDIVVFAMKANSNTINKVAINLLVFKYLIKSSPKYVNKVSFISYLYIIKPMIPKDIYITELNKVPNKVALSIFFVLLGCKGRYIGKKLTWNKYALR